MSASQRLAKRSFDFALAVAGSVVTLPVTLLAIAAATADTRRFGLFVQERIGRGGTPFPLFKVRTMRPSV